MNKLKCIIVDDEQGSHLVISHYLKEIKTLILVESFYNSSEALDYIFKNEIDIIFLDINMPGLSGIEMLEKMKNSTNVILTTAYKEFAAESYKYEVADYLIKPFNLRQFLSSIEKILGRMNSNS